MKSREKHPSPLDSQFSFHRFRKLRLYFAWPFVLMLAIYAKSTNQGFVVGAIFIVLGEIIRMWSHGYLRKSRRLAISGPYSYVRNPLYLGNFLIGFGFCIVVWHPAVAAVFVLGFFTVYWITIKGEEQRLAFRFGDEYKEYCKNTRRFIPRLRPYQISGKRTFFRWHRVWGHGEHITILAIISLVLILYLRQKLYQQHSDFTLPIAGACVLAGLLGVILIWTQFFRYGMVRKAPRLLAGGHLRQGTKPY